MASAKRWLVRMGLIALMPGAILIDGLCLWPGMHSRLAWMKWRAVVALAMVFWTGFLGWCYAMELAAVGTSWAAMASSPVVWQSQILLRCSVWSALVCSVKCSVCIVMCVAVVCLRTLVIFLMHPYIWLVVACGITASWAID